MLKWSRLLNNSPTKSGWKKKNANLASVDPCLWDSNQKWIYATYRTCALGMYKEQKTLKKMHVSTFSTFYITLNLQSLNPPCNDQLISNFHYNSYNKSRSRNSPREIWSRSDEFRTLRSDPLRITYTWLWITKLILERQDFFFKLDLLGSSNSYLCMRICVFSMTLLLTSKTNGVNTCI